MNNLVWPTVYLFAANNKETEVIKQLTNAGMLFVEVKGCYKGIEERSFLVIEKNENTEGLIKVLATMYDQESYLKVLPDRSCELVFTDSTKVLNERLGNLIAIDKSEVSKYDGWTYVPSLDQYYTIEVK